MFATLIRILSLSQPTRKQSRAPLMLEALEQRMLLAVTSAVSASGALTVNVSGNVGDGVVISCVGGDVKINGADPDSVPPAPPPNYTFPCAGITAITVNGDDSGNNLDLSQVTPADFTSLPNNSANPQVRVFGNGANDSITGAQQASAMWGGAGNDSIVGQTGDDSISGGPDNDNLSGGQGHDYIAGNDGIDTLNGGGGDDTLDGGANSDSLYGGLDNDELYGQGGNDVLNGNEGDDTLYGGTEDDELVGDLGDDWLYGELGTDHLWGDYIAWSSQDGDDFLSGGPGSDYIRGGGDFIGDTMQGGLAEDDYMQIEYYIP